ncbi:lysine--tRNA ligase [Candidatus Uhrbacteria bacterium]|nr:lysine--tRNA ligase [Candidatus Uhrbacteria bacterium]
MQQSDEYSVRGKKREDLFSLGIQPYPGDVFRSHTCRDAQENFDSLEQTKAALTIVGRVRSIRRHGGSCFISIQDDTGPLQIFCKRDALGGDYVLVSDYLDMGDILEATGTLMRTKTGEKTLIVDAVRMLAKALRPLPEQWHGLSDIEQRYRHRELDLLANEEVKERFIIRSRIVSGLRRFLDESGFMEVETPILQSIPGGANARPFVTHHNALDADFYLRIAPELYLKRLIIGGFEKIYEIGRLFRNEGIDHAHNPEFTSIELYWAYAPNKEVFVGFLENMVRSALQYALGTGTLKKSNGDYDFSKPWRRLTFREAIMEHAAIDIDLHRTEDSLLAEVKKRGLDISFDGCVGLGEQYDQLYKKTARASLDQPTWVFDYPLELKPLAKASPDDPSKSASVQLLVGGSEVINAYYHELNDPVDQRDRFLEQEALRSRGSADAQFLDEEFLFALEHALPPTSGMGLGIDRLVALCTGQSHVKEVILFPTLRQRKEEEEI